MKRTVLYLCVVCLLLVSGAAIAWNELLVAQAGSISTVDLTTGAKLAIATVSAPFSFDFGPDGKLYVMNYVGNSTGGVWQFTYDPAGGSKAGTQVVSNMQVGLGLAFDTDGYLWVTARNGSSGQRQAYRWTGPLMSPPWQGPSGNLIGQPTTSGTRGLGAKGGYLYAAVSAGTEIWKVNISDFTHTVFATGVAEVNAIAFGSDGSVYLSEGNAIRKRDSSGALIWSYTPTAWAGGVAVGPDGKVYYSVNHATNGTIHRLIDGGSTVTYDTQIASGLKDNYGIRFSPIPEPGSLLALAVGLIGLVPLVRRKRWAKELSLL